MRRFQHAVAGEADDGAVDLLVDFEIFPHFATAVMPFDATLQGLELLKVTGRHPDCGEFGGAALDPAQRLEQFDQFITA